MRVENRSTIFGQIEIMKAAELPNLILKKQSYLCVGLDPDPEKLPPSIPRTAEGYSKFCLEIIEATEQYAVSYKVNTAFFERLGSEGWKAMEIIFKALESKSVFTIADAKRADIGNTSKQYAEAFFKTLNADAITLAPYMGYDSIAPFLQYVEKTAILLALTSNPGHEDFEMLELKNGKRLFEHVIQTALKWERKGELMFVVGATRASEIASIRNHCPDTFLLVPGIGAQGGDLGEISKFGMNSKIGLLVNASRSILYPEGSGHFSENAAIAAMRIQLEMSRYLQ